MKSANKYYVIFNLFAQLNQCFTFLTLARYRLKNELGPSWFIPKKEGKKRRRAENESGQK